ncbi:MAG: Glu/Leu/Phe/Val dehydrogenase dimerization domain-containing protein, partial [Bacilli bacterium]|nr:Glu/Leu/Phe/Val dehydrogenase dimerization domain-containing protein [Bacilli bacterium]
QMFKNSLTGLPMGGGKGGSDFSPIGKSDYEIMRFCQSFMSELYRHIGADLDVPAGDFGVGAREIGYLFGYYKKLKNEFTGAFTGKGLSFGGSLVRREATGYGVCYFAEEILKNIKNDSLKGKRVIVTGSGNVGTYTAMKAVELGAKVIAMSDISGYIYDENGVDVNYVRDIKEKQKKNLDSYLMYQPSCKFVPDYKSVWTIKADIIFPCATQNELGIEEAKKIVANGTIMVCEGANMPTTIEATDYLMDHNILFAPGKAANAGGVATSGLEMSQNSMRFSWTAAEVDSKLHSIMENIFETCYNTAKKVGKEGNLVVGANIAGFLKIYEAMVAEGVI